MPSEFTYQFAQALIETPKVIIDPDESECLQKVISLSVGYRDSFILKAEDDDIFFKWDIKQSGKDYCRLSLHLLEKDSCIGIFRVDYVSYTEFHPNPCGLNPDVPEELKPYLAKDIYGPHAHFNVKGYKEMSWAIPLNDIQFATKQLAEEDGRVDLGLPIKSFADYINIQTQLIIEPVVI